MVILVCLSTYIALPASSSDGSDGDDDYGIILDGGSSGTKLKVFIWNRWVSHSTGPDTSPDTEVVKNDMSLSAKIKFEPDVGSFVNSLHDLGAYFDNIIKTAENVVPKEKHTETPIYFLATAGLRTLSLNDAENLLGAIDQYLRGPRVPFYTPENNVRVLSGEEEAVYAWVAANYLRGYFWSNRPPRDAVGVLEMGGGSTQIAFLPDHSVYANMFPVRLGGVTYHLYAHSYLLYGQNYIVSRINDYLLALNNRSKTVIENPCMLRGDNSSLVVFGKSVHIKGTANTTMCLEIIDIFLRTADDNWCYPKPCAIGRVYQPPVKDIVFYAISAFVYAPTYLAALDDMGRMNLALLKTNALKYCRKTLEEVVLTGLEAQYASPYCIMGLYIPSLLLDAYGFKEERNIVYVKSSINGVDIDWSLGAMLLLTENDQEDLCDTVNSAPFTHHLAPFCFTVAFIILSTFRSLTFS